MRRRVVAATLALAAALTMLVAVAAHGAPATVHPRAAAAAVVRPAQVVTVRASSASTTSAVLEVWARTVSGYRRIAGPWPARVGYGGVGRPYEGSGRTPAGVWPLGPAFGVGTANPGTSLPWFTATSADAWGSDVRSPGTYNRHVRCRPGHCPFREAHAERLVRYPRAYRYAVFIGYNAPPRTVVGAGSAFFLHVGTGGPTAGCVSVSAARMVWLLRHLRPGAVVSVGVGGRAYAPLTVMGVEMPSPLMPGLQRSV